MISVDDTEPTDRPTQDDTGTTGQARRIDRLETQAVHDRRSIRELHDQATSDHRRIDALSAQGGVDRELIRVLRAEGVLDRSTIAQLQDALVSARTIGTAVGIVMSRRQLTAEQAFGVLREASMNRNRKIRDLAEDVVLEGDLPA